MEPIWVNIFISQTYSCIKNRGIHKLANDLRKVLIEHNEETKYCLKLDIRKFYPSITHEILFKIVQEKVKDKNLLYLFDEIINSADGVSIGNYLSQFFANLYLAYFDHWAKETLKCKYYFRYADDIVVLSNDKEFLRNVLIQIKDYLENNLKLQLKPNYQIFPVESRGIDFVGYKFYHTHTLLRKSIKVRLMKLVYKYKRGEISKEELRMRLQAYFGWLKFCNSKHLLQKIQKLTGIRFSNWNGKKVNISRFYNKYIHIVDIVSYSKYFRVNFIYNKKPYYFNSSSFYLKDSLSKCILPVNFKIKPYEHTIKNKKCRKTSSHLDSRQQCLLLQF